MSEYGPLGSAVRPFWKPAISWFGVALLIVAVGGALVMGLGFMLGWFHTAVKVVSPANVTTQYRDAYSRWESLKATTCNIKSQAILVNDQHDPAVKVQLQSQLSAYEQNYVRIAADYNAAYDNAFAAKHVGPSDIPAVAPPLSVAVSQTVC